jgi:hypothetical protein
MFIEHVIYTDTMREHVAHIDFGRPFAAPAMVEHAPPKCAWQWRIDSLDAQDDDVFDDLLIRVRHRRAPHGESASRWLMLMIPQASTTTLDGLVEPGAHGRHFDMMTVAIQRSGHRRRLWLRITHTATGSVPGGGGSIVPSDRLPNLLKRRLKISWER